MNGSSVDDRGNDRGGAADRRIGEWAELSAMSRPPVASAEAIRARIEVGTIERRRSRRSVPGLAMVMLVVLVVAGIGFGVSRRQSAVAPLASPSAATSPLVSASPFVSANPTASPGPSASREPSASPQPWITSPGDSVADMGRIDDKNGWVYVGTWGAGQLMITSDAGATWRDATPPEAGFRPIIEFVDADHGWFLGTDALWRTADGGRSWHKTTLPAGTDGGSAAMSFVSASTGYLLLSANIGKTLATWALYRTDDAGASLQSAGTVALPDEPGLSGPLPVVAFSDRLDGLVAGWRAVLQTRDGGLHWSSVSLPTAEGTGTVRYSGVYQLRAFGPSVVLVAWIDGAANSGTTYVSGDAGRTWRLAAAEAAPDFWAIVDAQTWLELGGKASVRVRVTRDAGATWIDSTGTGPAGRHLMAVSFTSATDGWAIFQRDYTCPDVSGCPLPLPAGVFAVTHDGGVTWFVP